MEVFDLTSLRHFVKLCTKSYIEEKLAPVILLYAQYSCLASPFFHWRTIIICFGLMGKIMPSSIFVINMPSSCAILACSQE